MARPLWTRTRPSQRRQQQRMRHPAGGTQPWPMLHPPPLPPMPPPLRVVTAPRRRMGRATAGSRPPSPSLAATPSRTRLVSCRPRRSSWRRWRRSGGAPSRPASSPASSCSRTSPPVSRWSWSVPVGRPRVLRQLATAPPPPPRPPRQLQRNQRWRPPPRHPLMMTMTMMSRRPPPPSITRGAASGNAKTTQAAPIQLVPSQLRLPRRALLCVVGGS
mmetsp:Transcript_5894/g.16830  ORF Transcript_5894/g.16830 Transcript_5894/m.16830 type:complete len:217 (-) Transcript_5894:315-965(-)